MRRAVSFVVVAALLASAILLAPRATATPSASTLVPPLPATGRGATSPPTPRDLPFTANVRVSEVDTPGDQNEIAVAVAPDGRIHMAWNDFRQPNPDYRCGYAFSTDGGITWSANRLFHLNGWDADGDPGLAVDAANNVYVSCMAFSRAPGGSSRVMVYKSTDGGVNFLPGVTASDTTTGFNDKPWLHAIGSTLYLCYAYFVGAGDQLRVTRSFDGGATWEPTRMVDFNGNGCVYAHTSVTNLFLGWYKGGGIYVLRSTDAGATWSAPGMAGGAPWTDAPDQRAGPLPSLSADRNSGAVYAVWPADDSLGGWDVRFSRSTNGGVTWSGAAIVNDAVAGRQFMPWIDVDTAGRIHIAWYDDRSGRMAVRYTTSTDGGLTWPASVRVTDADWDTTFFIGDYINLVADAAGNVNVGWTDHRSGENEAFFARASATAPPPQLARIDVAPPEAWTDADTSVTFTASGVDQYGQPFAIAPAWAATGGTVLAGTYAPGRAGTWRVWANQSGISGGAIVHVTPGALARIDVTPVDVAITADGSVQYSATGYDAKGNLRSVAPSWAATDGAIDAAGLFTPQRVGTWRVYANASGVSGSTRVMVTVGVLASITVSPPTITITADASVQYTATGYDGKGNVVSIAPMWTAGGGSIDATGLYSAIRVGTWTVRASEGTVSGTAQVTVGAGALARLDVAPADAIIRSDQSVQYTANGYDADGNPVVIAPTWSVGGGSIDAAGLFTPDRTGTFEVRATASGIAGSTTVTVLPGPLARLDVEPPTATITADQFVQFTAKGYDAKGNRVAVAPAWSTTCGGIDAAGLYTPRPAGLCTITATDAGLSGSAMVTIVPGRLARIDVTPATATIAADDTVRFTARGYDAKGNEVGIAPAWTAEEGAIDAAALYTPRLVGWWTIAAEDSGVRGTARVRVWPGAVAAIDVTPPSPEITADDAVHFTATGRDAKGNAAPLGATVWTAADGSIIDGFFVPRRTGTWEITASSGGLRGTAHVAVRPGQVRSVTIDPGTARTDEGGVVPFTAAAFDGKGNAVPDAVLAWSVEGGIGTVGADGRFLATAGGQGSVVVTATGGNGSASARAPVLVDGGGASAVPAVAALFGVLFGILVAWVWRRRRPESLSPEVWAPSPRLPPPPPEIPPPPTD